MINDSSNPADPFSFLKGKPAAQTTYDQVAGNNPDEVAEVNAISKQTGKPSDFVAANLPVAKQAARYTPEFWAGLERNTPIIAKWAAVPQNMALAHDDLDNLTGIEKAHIAFKNKFKSMGGAVAGMVEATGGFISAGGSLDEKVLGMGETEKAIGGSIAEYGRKMAEYYAVKDPSFADKLVGAATSSAVFFIPGMGIARGVSALSAMPRLAAYAGAGLSAAFESAIEAGAVHETMKQQGKTDSEALAAASKTFGMNIGLNLALNKAGGLFDKAAEVKTIAKANAIKTAAKSAVKSGAAESIQEGSQQVISNSTTGQDLMAGTIESAILGGLVGGGMSGVMDVGQRLAIRKQAQASREYINELTAAVANSKTAARSPEALEGVMKELKAPPVLIPVEAFEARWKEAGITPEQAAKELKAEESYKAAKENGGDVLVPMALFQSKLMDEHRASFLNDFKLDPTHATRNEEIAADKEIGLLMQSEIEKAEKALDSEATPEVKAKRTEDRKALEALRRDDYETAVINKFGEEEGKKLLDTAIPLQARWDSVRLERARKANPALTVEQFYRDNKTVGKMEAVDHNGQPLADLTDEEIQAIDEQNYMDVVKEMGGVSPIKNAIREFGGIDYAKVKRDEMGSNMPEPTLGGGIYRKGGMSVSEMAGALMRAGKVPDGWDEIELADAINAETREEAKFKVQYGEAKYQKLRRETLYQAAVKKTTGGTVFYRGTKIGDDRRIKEPFTAAKGKTFITENVDYAKSYGPDVEKILAKPGAKILREDSPEFWELIGRKRPPNDYIGSVLKKGETLVDVVNSAIIKAEESGYDLISFKGDIGTVILNEDGVIRNYAAKDPSLLMQGLDPIRFFQSAWHGSPHDFDKFSLHAIGTGEGAQAYGYGLYFAGDKAVAEYYKKALTKNLDKRTLKDLVYPWEQSGVDVSISENKGTLTLSRIVVPKGERGKGVGTGFMKDLANYADDTGQTIRLSPATDFGATSKDRLKKFYKRFGFVENKGRNKDFTSMESMYRVPVKRGALYEVEIPDSDKMLDWDRPIDEQPKFVKDALLKAKVIIKDDVGYRFNEPDFPGRQDAYLGSEVYLWLGGSTGDAIRGDKLSRQGRGQEGASKFLSKIGITGIRYADGNTRNKAEQTHNYVIFDDNAVTILNKYYQAAKPNLTRAMFKSDQEFVDAVRKAYNLDDDKGLSRNEKAAKRWLEKMGGSAAAPEKIVELEDIVAKIDRRPAATPQYRGSYDPIARILTLGPKADFSTLLHELTHGYFTDIWAYIKSGTADEATKADFAVFMKWATNDPKAIIEAIKDEAKTTSDKGRAKELKAALAEIKAKGGVKFVKAHAETKFLDAATIGEREIVRQIHEILARGNEAYMREGKAPTPELVGIFSNFRTWLMKIYKAVEELRVTLSDDARGAFARMSAAEDEIIHAEMEVGLNDGELAAALPTDQAAALERVRAAAHEAAVSEVTARLMVEIAPEYKAKVEAKRLDAIKAFTAQVNELPLYRAINDLKDLFPDKSMNELAKAYKAEDTAADIEVAFDDVAARQNYRSADELATAILNSPTAQMEVERRLENYMEQFSPAHMDERIREWAMEAVNGEKQLEVLAIEKDILSDLGISQSFGTPYHEGLRKASTYEARIARAKAKAKLEGMKVRAATSYLPYINYEKKAAVKVAQAMAELAKARAEGDKDGAAKAAQAASVYKRQEFVNHALMLEALRLKEVVKKAVAYLETAGTKTEKLPSGKKLTITPEANEQVNALLFRYRLALPLPVAIGKAKVSLKQYVEAVKTRGDEVKVADWIVENVDTDNHSIQELTVEQLLDLKDAVKSLKYSGHRAKTFSTGEDIADFSHEKAVGIRKNLKERPVKYEPGDTNYILDKMGEFVNAHRSLTWICKTLDGFQHGAVSKFVMGRLRTARHNESVMGDKAAAKLEEIISKHYPASGNPFKKWEARAKLSSRKYAVDDKTVMEMFPGGVTKETAIMMLLNQGTELNRVRLLESYAKRVRGIEGRMEWVMPMGQEHIDKIIGILDKADVEFAQDVLDHVNSFWPQTAELERSRTGVMPIGREAIEITTKFGKLKGGYFHIAYDPRYSEKAATQSLEAASKGDAGYATPSTPSSHVKETVNHVFGRPLHLQFGAIDRHLKEVVHRLSFIETVRDLDLFFTNPEVTDAIVSTMGAKAYRQIRPVLVAVGFENSAKDNPVESIWDGLRVRTTSFFLMFRFASVLSQISGIGPAMRSVGAGNYLMHMKNLTPEKFQFMMDNSKVMRERIGNRDRDVRDAVKAEMKKGHPINGVKKYGFFMQGYMDVFVSTPQWYAAFDNEINRQMMAGEKIKPEDAVAVADEVVQSNQGSGDPIDQSAMQRGTPFMKLLSMFYTPFNPYANAEIEVWAKLRENGVKDMPALMSFMTFYVILPALVEGFVKGQMPDEEDDDNAWYAWAAKAVSSQVFGGWIGARDAANYLANGGKMGYRLTPTEGGPVTVLAPFIDMSKMAGNKFFDANYDVSAEKLAQDTADSFMFMAKLPGKQITLITKYAFALINGDDKASVKQAINPPKKDR